MLSFCLKCKKNTESIDPKVSATSNGKIVILSKCAISGSKTSKFIKKQEAKGLLNLGLLIVLVDHLLRIKKKYKSLNKLEIQDIFTKMNQIKLVFNMI